MTRNVLTVATLALSLVVAPSAYAATFTAVGDTTTMNFSFDGNTGDPLLGLMTATAELTVAAISSTSLVLTIELTNTTQQSQFPGGNAGLEAFGFATDPDADTAAVTTAGTVFKGAELTTIPSLSFIEVCTFAGVDGPGKDCAGGGQGSLLAIGATDTFTLTLTFDPAVDPASYVIAQGGVKFQTSIGSFEFGETGPGTGPGGGPGGGGGAPEPALLSLLGAGLAGLAYRVRRRT